MSKLFVISDLHLSFSDDKKMDVFPGWKDYAGRLETNWKNTVGADDTVVIPGDISWAEDLSGAYEDLRFLDSLPGAKILGKGNHDYWWNTGSKMKRFFSDNGFSTLSILYNNSFSVCGVNVCGTRGWSFDKEDADQQKMISRECIRLEMSLRSTVDDPGDRYVFMHYPPVFPGGSVCTELISVMKEYGVKRCLYGHLHAAALATAFTGTEQGITFDLVSADYLGFTPFRLI